MNVRADAIALVACDLDGTLIDSAPDLATAVNQALAVVDLPMLTEDCIVAMIGDGIHTLVERALSACLGHAPARHDCATEAARMLTNRITLTEFLMTERRRHPAASGDLNALVLGVALACKSISRRVARGGLGDALGNAQAINVSGEGQKNLDVVANDTFLRANEWGGHLAGMVSEEMEDRYAMPENFRRGKYLLAFDPLDGSSNIDVNVAVGSIFSITRAPHAGVDAKTTDFLQPGNQQVCTGYALYGPSTILGLTVGRCGVFMYPRDTCDPSKPGRLQLLYEANPISFIIEQAGGMASKGHGRILDLVPQALHERVALVLGSRQEVETIEDYHRQDYATEFDAPLFGERGLFRARG